MAVSLNNPGGCTGDGFNTSLTLPLTVASGTDRCVIAWTESQVTSVTYGGVALTQIDSRTNGHGAVPNTKAWRLDSPAVGTANLVASRPGAGAMVMGAIVLNGVDAGTVATFHYADSTFVSSPTNLSVTVPSGGIAVSFIIDNVIPTVAYAGDSGTTLASDFLAPSYFGYAVGYEVDATNIGYSWTGGGQRNMGHHAVVLTASGAADTTPPTITGPGGATGSTSSISVAENTTAVYTFSANESVTWDLNGGADVARFSINSSTGALSFTSAPDFETPTDADSNNTYIVGVRATDAASNATTQTVTVTVTDVAIPTAPTIGTTTSISYTTATINWTDNSSNETGFDVEVETPSGAGNWTAASTGASNPTAANATSLAITSLSMGTQYRPRVRARGVEGNSAWSTGTAFTTTAAGTLTLSDIHVKTLGELIGQSGQAGTFRVFADDDLTDEIATKTGTIDGGNDIALTDAAFTVGTWYRVYFLLANGNHGCARVQAT